MAYDDMKRFVVESFDKACEIIKSHEESCEECKKTYQCAESAKMYVIHGEIELMYYKFGYEPKDGEIPE
jgi:hypothetical protein